MISLKQIGCITENTLNWYIVRRPGHDLPPLEYTHVPELSPSNDLLEFYLDHMRNGTWNYEVFFNSYMPRFIKELQNDAASERLSFLEEESRKRDIALFCFCENETLCHRSIIGGILKGMSADIECPDDYLKYYNYYINEKCSASY